jgi:Glycosyl transferases group 1
MDGSAPRFSWTPLNVLGARLSANIQALAGRLPKLAETLNSFVPRQTYHILATSETIQLGVGNALSVTPLPHSLPAPQATNLIRQLYPSATCHQPVLIVGEDMGWLWNGIYNLPCQTPAVPGHRPPLFFLIKDIERLWVILHLHDWQSLLADERVRLFAGDQAMKDFRQSLTTDHACPWPRLSVRVDPTLWSGSPTLEEILEEAKANTHKQFHCYVEQIRIASSDINPERIASQFRSGRPMKILGITSRFTTFLQYSMRDWLASFERLGHRTRLIIEDHDHHFCNSLSTASACAEFQPDLVVIIDHYRRELGGIPEQIPVLMWVQDALPTIFCRKAGAEQGALDYAMGFSRLRMVHEFGYPAGRHMPAVIGCDEVRFQPRKLSSQEIAEFGCEVAFVSHASTPAEVILKTEIDRSGSPDAARLLGAIFEQMRGEYDAGRFITEPIQVRQMCDRALLETKTSLPDSDMPKLVDLFTHRINNALFRHQSLKWLADIGVNLRLYGRGWENHPWFARYARGIADNATQLSLIYQASRISLQVSPHGAVHQRVMEGLACGGFFLVRYCPGDVVERRLQEIWSWCISKNITNDAELRTCREPHIVAAIAEVTEILQYDPFAGDHPFIEALAASAQAGYIESAGTVWGEDYDAVAYRSTDELRAKVTHFLSDEPDRRRIAESMREVVLSRFTYLATSRRLLNFIADDLSAGLQQRVAA